MTVLHLTLKKKWFDMIASGEKKEEYRDGTDFWNARLMNYDWVSRNDHSSYKNYYGYKYFDVVRFKNGYSKSAPTIDVKFDGISVREGKPEWGAEPGKEYFVIKLGEVLLNSEQDDERSVATEADSSNAAGSKTKS